VQWLFIGWGVREESVLPLLQKVFGFVKVFLGFDFDNRSLALREKNML
jgi:hypothetical protein